ncbi:MAG: hypothetical protein ABJH28_16560 [Paraglaciecola sp.]|uniref:hypothetical protein n=1 Tax=Paraglaciecola sp. TaxID=1920173 RepID=UPI003267B84B
MQKYIFAYHGTPKFETPQEGAKHMEEWQGWSASLGDAIVDPGIPVGPSMTVTSEGIVEGGGTNPLSGITIIQAESIDAAMKMAQSCPHINLNGTIEVAEAMKMEM